MLPDDFATPVIFFVALPSGQTFHMHIQNNKIEWHGIYSAHLWSREDKAFLVWWSHDPFCTFALASLMIIIINPPGGIFSMPLLFLHTLIGPPHLTGYQSTLCTTDLCWTLTGHHLVPKPWYLSVNGLSSWYPKTSQRLSAPIQIRASEPDAPPTRIQPTHPTTALHVEPFSALALKVLV